jgi:hypothetical protein
MVGGERRGSGPTTRVESPPTDTSSPAAASGVDDARGRTTGTNLTLCQEFGDEVAYFAYFFQLFKTKCCRTNFPNLPVCRRTTRRQDPNAN